MAQCARMRLSHNNISQKQKGAFMTLNQLYSTLGLNSMYNIQILMLFLKTFAVIFAVDAITFLFFKRTVTKEIIMFYENVILKTVKEWDKKITQSTDAMFKKIQLDEDSTISEGLSLQMSKGVDYDDMARIIEEKISMLKEEDRENHELSNQ